MAGNPFGAKRDFGTRIICSLCTISLTSKRPFVDNEPSANAWKTTRTTPPTKVTDDPFIDDDRKSPSKSVPMGDKKIHEQMLIPVTTKMINSAVSEDNQFVLKDGRPLHLVKVVGAVVHYHEYWNNDIIGIEDGTGRIRVVLARCRNLECSGVKELYRKCAINMLNGSVLYSSYKIHVTACM